MSVLTSGLLIAIVAAPPKEPIHAGLVSLEHDQIRVGLDLAHGGAITWLSGEGPDLPSEIRGKNLVNNFDLGRQIQISHYAAPIPFAVGDQEPFPAWEQLGWNAVQAGDHFGNGSRVIEHEQTATSIAVKLCPRQWPLDNVESQAVFETKVSFDNGLVFVDAVMQSKRDDQFRPQPRHQEIPAIYVVSAFDRILVPTEEGLRRITQSEPGRWEYWTPVEPWSIAATPSGWGVGIFSPLATRFVGGHHGREQTWDEAASSTTYIAPLMTASIEAEDQLRYRYIISIGRVAEIAARFRRLTIADKGDESIAPTRFGK